MPHARGCRRVGRTLLKIALSVLLSVFGAAHVIYAQGPSVNWDKVRNYTTLAVKITVTVTGILIFVSALIRSAVAVLKRQLGGASTFASAQRDLYEAIEGPLYWLIALALAAWLPDILVAIGLLPKGTPFALDWNEIFEQP